MSEYVCIRALCSLRRKKKTNPNAKKKERMNGEKAKGGSFSRDAFRGTEISSAMERERECEKGEKGSLDSVALCALTTVLQPCDEEKKE